MFRWSLIGSVGFFSLFCLIDEVSELGAVIESEDIFIFMEFVCLVASDRE